MKPGELKSGDRVVIRGEHAGIDVGEIVQVWTTDNLPTPLEGDESATPAIRDQVEKILREWDITEVLWILHRRGLSRLLFVALVTSTGETRDLRQQRLTITRVPSGRKTCRRVQR